VNNVKLGTRNSKLIRSAQLLFVVLLAISFMGADVDARFSKLGHQLMCMCGCNQILLECNHVGCAYSERMRGELTAAMERADSDSLVLQSFVQKYGNTVLSSPISSGFNVIAWIMPFAVFALATTIAVWLVRRRKERSIAQIVTTPTPSIAEFEALRGKAWEETKL